MYNILVKNLVRRVRVGYRQGGRMKSKISLAGDLGSGKSTVSKILIDRLGAEYYSTGTIVRGIAERMGMTIGELNTYMETHPEIDTEIDNGLVALAEDERALIIDSRMAWHFTRGTFKVYLTTDIETAALRIMCANRKGEHSLTLEDTVRDTRLRRESEQKRYMEQYGVDIKDLANYSLVVDTTVATPEEVAERIIASLGEWERDGSVTECYISPERLRYIDDEPDAELLMEYSSLLDYGESIPLAEVFYENGDFFVERGTEAALAHAFNMATLVPVRLVRGSTDGRTFIRMENSL